MIESILQQIKDVDIKNDLKNSLTLVFKNIQNEIYDAMDSVGEAKDEYHISIYPFALSRIDDKPVPRKLLLAIQKRLRKTTKS